MLANLVFVMMEEGFPSALTSAVAPSMTSCTLRAGSMAVGFGFMGGSLKAWERSFSSARWEKDTSRRRVNMWEKVGESMRSDVSLRRWRRAGCEEGGAGEGDGVQVGTGSCRGDGEPDVDGGVENMPDSWRTKSSWSWGGSRYGSHFRDLAELARFYDKL